jgi:hypothetical protein
MGTSPGSRSWILRTLGVFLLLSAGAARAQVDAPAAVTGRWEGTTEVMSPRFPATRVLVIQNLRQESTGPDATKWKGDGRYGPTADKMGRVDVTVTAAGSTVTVEFVTPEALHVTLKLVKANVLEGTHVTTGGQSRRMHLERRD